MTRDELVAALRRKPLWEPYRNAERLAAALDAAFVHWRRHWPGALPKAALLNGRDEDARAAFAAALSEESPEERT